jgi:serine/threonine-protein kinase
MTRGPQDWENRSAPSEFAGIPIDDLEWARQRGRRVLLLWLVAVLTLTGLIAAGAWTLGNNLQGLF